MAPFIGGTGRGGMAYPDLYLMRHGETEWNVAGRLQGRLDSPLTPRGLRQAQRQRDLIGNLQMDRYSSPQRRAVLTAQTVFGTTDFAQDDRLAEIDVGDFTGLSLPELQSDHPQVFENAGIFWYDRTPNGERFAQLQHRVTAFLRDLSGPAMIVTHGVTLRMLRLVAMAWPIERLAELTVEQGAVHIVRNRRHEVWR